MLTAETMTNTITQPLLTPGHMGNLELPNRIVMAPLTRGRADNPGHVPTDLQAQYYAQRASAGIIITEDTAISPQGFGWAGSPGLWTDEQVRGWSKVTDAVHNAGGRIISQLWHTGAMSHPEMQNGAPPVSASNVNPLLESVTPSGRKPTVQPRPLTTEEVRQTVLDFKKAATNAMKAGFDGVQVQANYVYLIAQFLNSKTNLRTDEYGGTMENRARFLWEILEAILSVVDNKQVGIKSGPMNVDGNFLANADTLPTHEYIMRKLNDYNLMHVLLMGATTDFSETPLASLAGEGMFRHFRAIYNGKIIANVGIDADNGNSLIKEGIVDFVAFGRPYIANPDLVQRITTGAKLSEDINWDTVYTNGPEGYIDYPTMNGLNT
jgi:N-ethylmaleimide reductase